MLPQHIVSRLLILLILAVATFWAGAVSAQTTYQAENGSLAGGVFVAWSRAGYTGSGYIDGFTSSTSKVTLNVSLPAGLYELTVRYYLPYGQKGYDVTVNGTTTSLMFPSASGWATTSAGKVLLNATNTISIGGGWGWYLIDSITLTPTTVAPPPKPASTTPVDPLATQQTKDLFTFLRNQYGDKTVSGQQEINDVTDILSKTGRRPGILSQDLIDYSPTRVEHGAWPAVPTEQIISLVQQYGHICSITWHWNAPMHLIDSPEWPWWRGFYTQGTTYDLAYALANPSSPEYQALIRDLDAIAVQLAKLQNANIPVLWRPLHEAEGGWFWWGAKGPGPFVELWRLMYNRYTQVHGLHNLIWVFTAQSANLAWYPGDAYVDVVGADRYPTDVYDPLSGIFDELQTVWAGKKMLALSEFGGMADVGKMRQYGVYWAWVASWNGFTSGYTATELTRLYSDPRLLNAPVSLDVTPPTLSSITINSGAAQRSMVRQVDITFSEAVNLSDGAISLRFSNGSAVPNLTLDLELSSDPRTYVLRFSGTAATGGSLPDGIYELLIAAAGVQDQANNPMAANSTYRFHRLFGDADGNKVVNASDYTALRNSFDKHSTDPGFNDAFDYENNLVINASDLTQFRKRFNLRYVY